MPIYFKFLGKADGNFRLGPVSRNDLISSIEQSKEGNNFPVKFFIPRCDFTNRIASPDGPFDKWNDNFLVSKELADGIILSKPYHAALMFNADCLMVGVYDISTKRLAVIHGGFRCLVREQSYEKGILETLFSEHNFNPRKVFVNVGWGIGECCYGAEEYPEIKNTDLVGDQSATKGPRAGSPSIDIRRATVKILKDLNVDERAIEVDRVCTACSGRKSLYDAGDYHSHVWDGADAGRNAMIMWYSDVGLRAV